MGGRRKRGRGMVGKWVDKCEWVVFWASGKVGGEGKQVNGEEGKSWWVFGKCKRVRK